MREFEHFCVCVRSSICMCEWLSFCMCVSKGCTDAVMCCPPALRFGLAFPGPLRPVRLRLSCAGSTEPVACAACQTVIFDTARTTPSPPSSMLRLVRDCFCGLLLLLVCLLLMLACMCVVLRVACCGVLQRRHNSDAVLKRLGSRHACKLTLNWLGTATRHRLSDDSLCGHLRVP